MFLFNFEKYIILVEMADKMSTRRNRDILFFLKIGSRFSSKPSKALAVVSRQKVRCRDVCGKWEMGNGKCGKCNGVIIGPDKFYH